MNKPSNTTLVAIGTAAVVAGVTSAVIGLSGPSAPVNAHITAGSISASPSASDSSSPVALAPSPTLAPVVSASPTPKVVVRSAAAPTVASASVDASPSSPAVSYTPPPPPHIYVSAGNCIWHNTAEKQGYSSSQASCTDPAMTSPSNSSWVIVFRGPGYWTPPSS